MSEATPIDPFSFLPFEGGLGKRISLTTSSARGAIPGTQATVNRRILVTNGGAVSAFVRMGQSDVVATLDCLEILPGVTVSFTVPSIAPSGLYVAGITAAGATKIQITAGQGV